MKVFKFGGASIKDASAIKNMAEIIRNNNDAHPVIVVSAMGKTTNALEKIVFSKEPYEIESMFNAIVDYHEEIVSRLFHNENRTKSIFQLFHQLKNTIYHFPETDRADKFYDAIVSYGELISSSIISDYLQESKILVEWLDARKLIITDDTYREGKVIWKATCKNITGTFAKINPAQITITQGFIGSTETGDTTTLGREGSDFTAAIIAYCLEAESVIIWKDVPGILNADPKRFSNTCLYENLSYQEAAEMTYYGASVIHPKTIKPLANKGIPLHVKSFENPEREGTLINQGQLHGLPPTYVVKDQQCLVSFVVKDLDFINEHNLSVIFHVLDMLNIKINMMQNSAVSLTICIDNQEKKTGKLIETLRQDYKIMYNENLRLITVKNYTAAAIEEVSKDKNILVEQRSRNTFQIVVDD